VTSVKVRTSSSSEDLKFYVDNRPPKMYILFLKIFAEKQLRGLNTFLFGISTAYQTYLSVSKHHTSFKSTEVFLPFESTPWPSPPIIIRYFY